uniref:Uncharacterized protein n=1 Tax=Glossina pallidipes TaxID=7398 RepID=A0A1A9Z4I0_GLOPL
MNEKTLKRIIRSVFFLTLPPISNVCLSLRRKEVSEAKLLVFARHGDRYAIFRAGRSVHFTFAMGTKIVQNILLMIFQVILVSVLTKCTVSSSPSTSTTTAMAGWMAG